MFDGSDGKYKKSSVIHFLRVFEETLDLMDV